MATPPLTVGVAWELHSIITNLISMKKIIYLTLLTLPIIILSCQKKGRYLNLNDGQRIEIEKDPATGYMVDMQTKKPVYIYVDTETKDTLYGRTGRVINNKVVRSSEDKYEYEDGEFTYKDGDYKLVVDGNGAYKIKDGDYKKKVEKDGDIKIKDGDTKIKIDGETGEKKVKH